MQPSAEDILVQTLETVKNMTDGHAVVAIARLKFGSAAAKMARVPSG
jgi:hypothetical protein